MPDPINSITPGTQLSQTEKEALAKINAELTSEAHRLAAEHRARDARQNPLAVDIADSIKVKLEQLPPEE